MFDLSAMTMADQATRDHVMSARPAARTRPGRRSRPHGAALRRLGVVALRRLADRIEPKRLELTS